MASARVVLSILLFFAASLPFAAAQGYAQGAHIGEGSRDTLLTITVWDIDLNPRPTYSTEELLQRLDLRARRGIAGLLYGYRFEYTLENRARDIEELFSLATVREIGRDDERLVLLDSWRDGEILYGRFGYRATLEESARMRAWRSSPTARAAGRGSADLWSTADEQQQAIEGAIKEAITDYLRANYANKPHRVSGSALLHDAPRLYLRSGAYLATLAVNVRIDNVDQFRYF